MSISNDDGTADMNRRPKRFVRWATAMLAIGMSVSACGQSVRNAKTSPTVDVAIKLPKVGRLEAPEDVPGIPILAKGILPGGGKFVIYAQPHRAATGRQVTYSAMLGTSEPAKYAPPNLRNRPPWGKAGGIEMNNRWMRGLQMDVTEECDGPYAYNFAWALLRNIDDSMTARLAKGNIRFKTTVIPARLHPFGALAYAVLPEGSAGREVVIRTPSGRVVSEEAMPGPESVPGVGTVPNQGRKCPR